MGTERWVSRSSGGTSQRWLHRVRTRIRSAFSRWFQSLSSTCGRPYEVCSCPRLCTSQSWPFRVFVARAFGNDDQVKREINSTRENLSPRYAAHKKKKKKKKKKS